MLFWKVAEYASYVLLVISFVMYGCVVYMKRPRKLQPDALPPDGMVRSSRYNYMVCIEAEVLTFGLGVSDEQIEQHLTTRRLRRATEVELNAFCAQFSDIDLSMPRRYLVIPQ